MNRESAFSFRGTGRPSLFSGALLALMLTLLLLALPVNSSAATPMAAHFDYAQVTLGGGFSFPNGVAVDGSGNVFVADSGSIAVKEIPRGCVNASCVKSLSGPKSPAGVAVDESGNLFVGFNSGSGGIAEILAAGGYTTPPVSISSAVNAYGIAVDKSGDVFVVFGNESGQAVEAIVPLDGHYKAPPITVGGSYGALFGVAVDGSGNVFVADASAGEVKVILPFDGYTNAFTLASGFFSPFGVAVDGNGNVFVADNGLASGGHPGAVYEILAAGDYTVTKTLGTGFSAPQAIALDGSGNVYVADGASVVELSQGSFPADFGTVAVGQTSAVIPLTFTFDNGGTIGGPVALTQGAAGLDFAIASGGTCTADASFATGATCTVNVTFTPKVAGLRNGAVLLQDGSGNTVATAHVHGTGSGPQVAFLPGVQSALGSAIYEPAGVAVDGAGNVYVASPYYEAVVEILAAGGYTTVRTFGSSDFPAPAGVAVDGAGNIFVTDTNQGAVKEILASGGSIPASPTINTLASGFNNPYAVAVDGAGNVYVADANNNAVKEILAVNGSIPASPTINILGSGFNQPHGVAVDASGNVFVADAANFAVKEILAVNGSIPTSPTINTLGSGFELPFGVAVDASGNVFVADQSLYEVKEIMAVGGSIPTSPTIITLGRSFDSPHSIAVDGSGNVYVADTLNEGRVSKVDLADAPSLSFGSISVGSTSPEQTVTLQNIGNMPLNISPISVIPNYPLGGSVAACTSTSQTLAEGAYCGLGIEFVPQANGIIGGSIVLTDNALNAANARQTIALQGTGTGGSLTWQTISFPNPAGPFTYGGTPVTLTASSTSGLPVTYSVVSGPAKVSGSTLTITGAGAVVVQAAQAGNTKFAAATPVSVTIKVNPAVLTVTANNASMAYGGTVPTFTASYSGFVNGDTLAKAVTGSPSFTTTATSVSLVGKYAITAAKGTLAAANYTFQFVNGAVTITPYPTITGLSPSSAVVDGPAFTLTINGAYFRNRERVLLSSGEARL